MEPEPVVPDVDIGFANPKPKCKRKRGRKKATVAPVNFEGNIRTRKHSTQSLDSLNSSCSGSVPPSPMSSCSSHSFLSYPSTSPATPFDLSEAMAFLPLQDTQHTTDFATSTPQGPSIPCNLVRGAGYIYDPTDTELKERFNKFQWIDQNIYRPRRSGEENDECQCGEDEDGDCGEECLNRMSYMECSDNCPSGDRCKNKQFTKLEYRKLELELFKAAKKGYGVRTLKKLPRGGLVIEYVGEVIREAQFRKRRNKYTKINQEHFYFMILDAENIIDSDRLGNVARFINHSCEPNCVAEVWIVNGKKRIWIFALRDLAPGEEITFDYQFQVYGKIAQPCYCLAPKCRAVIGTITTPKEQNGNGDVETKLDPKVKMKKIQRRRKMYPSQEEMLISVKKPTKNKYSVAFTNHALESRLPNLSPPNPEPALENTQTGLAESVDPELETEIRQMVAAALPRIKMELNARAKARQIEYELIKRVLPWEEW